MEFENLLQITKDYYKAGKTEFDFYDEEKFKIGNSFGNVFISKAIVKCIWTLSYINFLYYNTFMAGMKPNTRQLNPNAHYSVFRIILEKRKQIETYFLSQKENNGANGMPDIPPDAIGEIVNPSYQPYISPKDYYIVNQCCSYALFFWLLHEFGHNRCPIPEPHRDYVGGVKFSEEEIKQLNEIECWCDDYAFKEYKKILLDDNNISISDCENAKIGMQIAMLFFVVKSFDQNFFDGIDHPEIYKRICTIMEPVTSDDDKTWCLLDSFLAFEFKDIHSIVIGQKKFRTHKEASLYLVDLIKQYDETYCKTKIFPKKKNYYASDFGVWSRVYYDKENKIDNYKEEMSYVVDEYWYGDFYSFYYFILSRKIQYMWFFSVFTKMNIIGNSYILRSKQMMSYGVKAYLCFFCGA